MADILGSIITGALIICGIIIVGLIGFVIILNFKYKHFVRVRKIIKGRTVIIDDKARLYKDRWRVEWWKLRKLKSKIPVPPSGAIDLTIKAKLCCEYYLSEDGAYIPITDDFSIDKLKKLSDICVEKRQMQAVFDAEYKFIQDKQKEKIKLDEAETNFVKNYEVNKYNLTVWEAEAYDFMQEFKPLTTQERALMTHEHTKALEYNKKKGMNEMIATALMFGVPVLIIIVILLFAPDTIESFGTLVDKLDSVAAKLDATAGELANTKAGIVELQNEGGTPEPPN